MKYPIPFPATIKCRAANIIPISINAIPYNTFIHCIFNFIQALLSYEGLDISQQAILQGKIRKWVLASYACYESFIPCYLLQREAPFCQKRVKKNPVIPLYLFVFSIILTIMCLLFIMCI